MKSQNKRQNPWIKSICEHPKAAKNLEIKPQIRVSFLSKSNIQKRVREHLKNGVILKKNCMKYEKWTIAAVIVFFSDIT